MKYLIPVLLLVGGAASAAPKESFHCYYQRRPFMAPHYTFVRTSDAEGERLRITKRLGDNDPVETVLVLGAYDQEVGPKYRHETVDYSLEIQGAGGKRGFVHLKQEGDGLNSLDIRLPEESPVDSGLTLSGYFCFELKV